MKRRGIKDERIIAELHKLNSHGFAIVFIGLMASLVVKLFVLHWDMKYWLDTFLILMAACLYITVRGIRAGLYLLPAKEEDQKLSRKMNLAGGLLGSIVWAVLMLGYDLMGNDKVDMTKSLMSTLAGAIVFFFGITGLQWLMLKRSHKNADKTTD